MLRFGGDATVPEEEIRALLEQHGFRVSNIGYGMTDERAFFEYRMVIRTTDGQNLGRLARPLVSLPNVREFRIQQSAA